MNKPLPQKVSDSGSESRNPDPAFFVEVEGDNGPEYLPIPSVLAESAMRQAEAAERSADALEKIAKILEIRLRADRLHAKFPDLEL